MRPVFIVGAPRSGSSLLYRTLQRHPSFRCPHADGGLNLQETDIVRHLPDLPWFKRGQPRRLWQYMLRDAERFDEFLRLIEPLKPRARRFRAWDERLQRVSRGRLALSRRLADDEEVIRAFFVIAKEARGPERLVEKTPHHVAHVDLFRRAFPQARFLYIHRHPVDVYSSYRRRAQEDSNADWARLSVDEFVDLYGEMSEAAQEESVRPDVQMVPYERFVAQPEDAFGAICTFLDEPFVVEALEVERPDATRWKPDPLLFAEITDGTKDWSEYVTVDEAREVEARLAEVMQGWHYDPYTDV